MGEFFNIVFNEPVLNVFYGIYNLTQDVGIAIVFMALIIRVVMWPFIRDSYITGQKTRQIQPLIKALQKQYKGDVVGMQGALKELYAKYDIKPSLAGLIILLQLPIYFALFELVRKVNEGTPLVGLYGFLYGDIQPKINPLAFSFIHITDKFQLDQFSSNGSVTVLLLTIATMVCSFYMAKYIFPPTVPGVDKPKPVDDPDKKEPLIDPELFNKTLQFQFTYLMPILSFVINIQFAAGLNLYFLAGTVFSLIQQIYLVKKYRIDGPQIMPEVISATELPAIDVTATEITDSKPVKKTAKRSKPKKKDQIALSAAN